MSEIEAPKVKRTYTRKPKVVVDEIPQPVEAVSDSDSSTSSTLSLTPPEKLQKPKRKYTRKAKCVMPHTTQGVLGGSPNGEVPVETIAPPPDAKHNYVEPIVVPEPVVEEPVKVKRERTDKQKAAFEKMRLARVAKQAELNKLKDLEKQEKLLDKEKNKLDTITEKILEKTTAIKQRKSRSKSQPEVIPEPQQVPIIQETRYRNIVFA
jgi:hypothetical protein